MTTEERVAWLERAKLAHLLEQFGRGRACLGSNQDHEQLHLRATEQLQHMLNSSCSQEIAQSGQKAVRLIAELSIATKDSKRTEPNNSQGRSVSDWLTGMCATLAILMTTNFDLADHKECLL